MQTPVAGFILALAAVSAAGSGLPPWVEHVPRGWHNDYVVGSASGPVTGPEVLARAEAEALSSALRTRGFSASYKVTDGPVETVERCCAGCR